MTEALLFGVAKTATAPATAGLFGVGGEFVMSQALLTVGTAVGGVGSLMGATAGAGAAEYNAGLAEREAARERQLGAAREQDFREQQSRLRARNRALQAGTGRDLSTGTSLLTDEDLVSRIELEAARLRSGAEAQATGLESEAKLARYTARAKRRAGMVKAGTTLLTGFGDVFSGGFG